MKYPVKSFSLRSRRSEYCRNGVMLGTWRVNTHLLSMLSDFAMAAACAITPSGNPERSSFLSIISLKPLVSASRFCPNLTCSIESSSFILRSLSLSSGDRDAPLLTKSLYVSSRSFFSSSVSLNLSLLSYTDLTLWKRVSFRLMSSLCFDESGASSLLNA